MRNTRKQDAEIAVVQQGDAKYPYEAMCLLGKDAPECIFAIGNLDILDQRLLAIFCSFKCPGRVILQTYDAICALRDAGIAVISGFHSPIEKECLRLLLRGTQPIVICPARSIERMRIPTEWRVSLATGRLLILSPFDTKHSRVTAEAAAYRNRFAAALADRILIPYTAPASKTEAFAQEVEGWEVDDGDRHERSAKPLNRLLILHRASGRVEQGRDVQIAPGTWPPVAR